MQALQRRTLTFNPHDISFEKPAGFFKTNHPMLGSQWWVDHAKPAWAFFSPRCVAPQLRLSRHSSGIQSFRRMDRHSELMGLALILYPLFVFSHQSFNETPLPAYDWNVFSMMAQAMRQILTFWRYEWHVCMGHHSHVVAKNVY